ncbi:MAG TPA: hypothetical protein DHW82_02795 [Spirochaetia bacterium]|nr:MAG: hypothetical protein A2Y41_03755 [Spirochaetes bacterium GWB1_36_13]HCL55919.1 hypothetical protein [Spirochaetia bacterium]
MKKKILFGMIFLLPFTIIWSAKTIYTSFEGIQEFSKGTFVNTSLDKTGRILLSPEMKEIFNNKDLLVYSLAKKGDFIYAGTGNTDVLYEINLKTGESKALYKGRGLSVNTLALSDDALYFTESPSNTLYKMNLSDKKIEKTAVFDKETYLWKLIYHDGKLYAATGDSAAIYEIDEKGTKTELYKNEKENHFLSLAAYKNSLYFGSEGNGVLYELDLKTKKVSTLYDTYEDEINDIYVNEIGEIYFVTSAQAAKIPGLDFDYTDTFLIQEGKPKKSNDTTQQTNQNQSSTTNGNTNAKKAVVKNSLYSFKKGKIYKHFTRDNTVLYTVTQGNDGNVYVGGGAGLLYRFNEKDNNLSVFLSLKEEQILSLIKDKDQIYAATGNLGKVFALSYSFSKTGEFVSRVIDMGGEGKIGSVSWESLTPEKTSVKLFIRSGNSEKQDETWSDWTGPYVNPEGSIVALSKARYLQYKVVLATSDFYQTPVFQGINQPFLLKNRQPTVSYFKVNTNETNSKKENYILTANWNVYDSDNDKLFYQLSFKEKNDKVWLPLTDRLYGNSFDLDTRVVPDGIYQLKLTVSDEMNNTADDREMIEEVSRFVTMDNTAPVLKEVKAQKIGEFIRIDCTVLDNLNVIAGGYYTLNAKEWAYFLPKDGIFDNKIENFELVISDKDLNKDEEENIVFVRVFDAQENQLSFKVKIDPKGKIINAELQKF